MPAHLGYHRAVDEGLVEEVAARVRRRWPQLRVDVVGRSGLAIVRGGVTLDVQVESLRARLAQCADALARDAVLARFLEGIAIAVDPPPDRVEDVIATLRARELVEQAMRGCVSRPFAGDLAIVYGFDSPVGTRFAVQSAFAALGLADPGRLHELALANLAARLPPADAFEDLPGCPGVYVREADPLEPDRLLLTGHWPVIEEALGGAMLASAPARGVLLIAGADAVDRLFDATHVISKRHPEPLGRAILRWSAQGWRVNLG